MMPYIARSVASVICLFLLQLSLNAVVCRAADAGILYAPQPAECDLAAATACEYEFLTCRLFSGPVDDPPTLCKCGELFYGECLRAAGCSTTKEVGALSLGELYMKKCVDHIIKYDCDNTLMCSVNCASPTSVGRNDSKIIPFNNYSKYYLRIRICKRTFHKQKMTRYSQMEVGACTTLDTFDVCARWVPPFTFVPVALPSDTVYLEVDKCVVGKDRYGNPDYNCYMNDPAFPKQMLFGNSYIFPRTFDIEQSMDSICLSDADCLGSYCDTHRRPPMCSPKTMVHVTKSGANYLSDPFG